MKQQELSFNKLLRKSKKYLVLGCLVGASFFVGCQQQEAKPILAKPAQDASADEKAFEPEMYEASELALLMRKMYEDNMDLRAQIDSGHIPESFPKDFYNIHIAQATKANHKDETFKALANKYLENMQNITEATNTKEAKIAYNQMVMTCASCHQIYCRGPLKKIQKMKFALHE